MKKAKTLRNSQENTIEPAKYGLYGPLASKLEAQQRLVGRYIDEVTTPQSNRGLSTQAGDTLFIKSSKGKPAKSQNKITKVNKYFGKHKVILLTNKQTNE